MIYVECIRASNSPWASAVILVMKKNGKLCFCIDLRILNSFMVKDAYSILRIQDILDCLQVCSAVIKAQIDVLCPKSKLTSIGLKASNHNQPIRDQDIKYNWS